MFSNLKFHSWPIKHNLWDRQPLPLIPYLKMVLCIRWKTVKSSEII